MEGTECGVRLPGAAGTPRAAGYRVTVTNERCGATELCGLSSHLPFHLPLRLLLHPPLNPAAYTTLPDPHFAPPNLNPSPPLSPAGAPRDPLHTLHTFTRALPRALQARHGIRPGVSWGSLPLSQREGWSALGCDRLLGASGDGGPAGLLSQSSQEAQMVRNGRDSSTDTRPFSALPVPELCACTLSRHMPLLDVTCCACTLSPQFAAEPLPSATQPSAELFQPAPRQPAPRGKRHGARQPSTPCPKCDAICRKWRDGYHVVVGQSWGALPASLRISWDSMNCDQASHCP